MKKLLLIILLFAGLTGFKPVDTRKISGKVYAKDDGLPMPGVTVKIKGTNTATQTNAAGHFTINVPQSGAVLTFSFIGYQGQELTVDKQDTLSVYMVTSNNTLGEVVVTTSIGVRRQAKELGYSTARTDSKSISTAPPTNYTNGLTAKAPGLVVTNVAPGAGYFAPANSVANNNTNDESYKGITENGFNDAKSTPLSTFSVDVDAASYSNLRRFINGGELPPPDAVRIEEMINYFGYNLTGPVDNSPVAIHTELSSAPWNPKHRLLRIGLKAKTIANDKLPASNLVFLIDVSGSMNMPNKLPLVKAAMKMLTDQLRPQDKVAIVVYAGEAGLVLPSTAGDKKSTIKNAIDNLSAGGSTAGGEGIKLAYRIAKQNFMKKGNNRIILATDGDFNVGASSDGDMEHLIIDERESGVAISIMSFGMGNYKDSKMETMADKGNGNYAYIDNITEARKAFVTEYGGTMFTVAKDVKIQVEFNPAKVQAYRLLGYEDRMLEKEDFNNDRKDAGDMGSGHTVTALYEIVPAGIKDDYVGSVDPLKYQKPAPVIAGNGSDEMLTIKFRYKERDSSVSKMKSVVVKDKPEDFKATSADFRFASSVAEFGMLLRNSQFKQQATFDQAITIAKNAKGTDPEGYRAEFIRLAESAKLLVKTELVSE